MNALNFLQRPHRHSLLAYLSLLITSIAASKFRSDFCSQKKDPPSCTLARSFHKETRPALNTDPGTEQAFSNRSFDLPNSGSSSPLRQTHKSSGQTFRSASSSCAGGRVSLLLASTKGPSVPPISSIVQIAARVCAVRNAESRLRCLGACRVLVRTIQKVHPVGSASN